MTKSSTIYWFRQDLRLQDNHALSAALKRKQPIILLYILDDETFSPWQMGSASRWWLHHSLKSLAESIQAKGGQLIFRKGKTLEVLEDIIKAESADALYFQRQYEPQASKLEEQVHAQFADQINIKRYGGYLLFEPEQLRTGKGEPYKVFTPFWKSCLRDMQPPSVINAPRTLENCISLKSDKLSDWKLLPTKPNWATGFDENWQPGETGAKANLKHFLQDVSVEYDESRNRPDKTGTSRLSPHLHFGEISPAQIWQTTKTYIEKHPHTEKGGMSFLRELGWRDFSYHLLFHWPTFPENSFRSEFDDYPWQGKQKQLKAWQQGLTGYPIVDAGMRELWHTGWMHNRVRMVVASFLIKDLLIDWRQGEDWFWDTLVDADLASNSASWQWVAGCGADAAPYYRIFNPTLQGKKFDPNGEYVRKWIPEISGLSNKTIHEPWNASPLDLAEAEITLGKTYPLPIVDHAEARDKALELYKSIKKTA